jgi:drug/metabolite transporter (DMT)-like permease
METSRLRVGFNAVGMMSSKNTLPNMAVMMSGVVWGVTWLPLRALEDGGFDGAWTPVPPILAGVIMLLPFVLWRWRRAAAAGWPLAVMCMAGGTGYALYSDALLLTEVVTAILLFYLTPVWSTILARLFLGQPITAIRMVAIALGFAGLWVILGIDGGFPMPRGLGDCLGLVSGMIWAGATVGFRKRPETDPALMAFYYLLGTLIAALVIAFAFMPLDGGVWNRLTAATLANVPLILLSGAIMYAVTMVVQVWASQRLDPGRVGVLLMIEVPVAVTTAALFTDEPFGWRQVVGAGLILSAAGAELLFPAALASPKNS